MRRLSIVLTVGALALVGCADDDDDGGGSNGGGGSTIDSERVAEMKSQVVAGEFEPAGCASRDITRFIDNPEDIASAEETNRQAAKVGAPGHVIVTDETGQIGVNTYKVSAECRQSIERTLNEATGP